MAESLRAPGLTADWLNAWLAAIGITVLLPDVTLHWTDDPLPVAVFDVTGGTKLAGAVWAALPGDAQLRKLAIARQVEGYPEFPRKVDENAYRARASLARGTADFSLAISVTDLTAKFDPDGLRHAPFDPPAPKGETLWNRLVKCRAELHKLGPSAVEDTLAGRGHRVEANGLGFDARRLVAGVHPAAKKSVDPVVECLAFFGLSLFPLRGDGRDVKQRGWIRESNKTRSFVWPAWKDSLDRWAIDALIDQVPASLGDKGIATRWGINDWFRSVPYAPMGSSDATRAYFSQRFSSDNTP